MQKTWFACRPLCFYNEDMKDQLYGKKIRFALTVALLAAVFLSGCGKKPAGMDFPAEITVDSPGDGISAPVETPGDVTEATGSESPAVATETVSSEYSVNDTKSFSAESSEPVTEPFSITLAFAGDINFDDDWCVMATLHSLGDDLTTVIDPAYLDEMRSADLLWINNEFCYSDRGAPMEGKAYTFRSAPSNVKYLQEMGVDLAGLANNHVFDYGEEAFLDTLQTLQDADIPYVGAGKDLAEASAPVFLDADGVTVAYVAASRAEKNIMTPQAEADSPGILRCYDMTLFLDSIKKAAELADFVIALPHWGTEYSTTLEQAQIDGARECIDAGADAVIGAHTHCLQGVSSYHEKPIAYSLGNFWFNERTLDTMLFELRLSGTKTTAPDGAVSVTISDVEPVILPGTQSGCITTMASGEKYKEILQAIDAISPAPE